MIGFFLVGIKKALRALFGGSLPQVSYGKSKALKGTAAMVFGGSPNMNMKLDVEAIPVTKKGVRIRDEFCLKHWGMTWDEMKPTLPRRDVLVYSTNLPAGASCPGKSDFCSACYAKKGRCAMNQWKYENTWAYLKLNRYRAIAFSIMALPRGSWVRVHASGDFCDVDQINAWIVALTLRPDIRAWGYTRSWAVQGLLPALEKLRALPNMQLFASIDPTMQVDPPAGWRVAYIEGDERYEGTGFQCPAQLMDRKRPDCKACALCVLGKKGNIRFMVH